MGDEGPDLKKLELVRWGLRFADHETERAFRSWHVHKAAPFTRGGMIASLVAWAMFLWMAWMAHFDLSSALVVVAIVVPLVVGSLFTTYRPALSRWVLPSTIIANMAAGLCGVGFSFWVVQIPVGGMSAATAVGYFGFVIFRLRPWQAVVAVAPYILLNQILLLEVARAGHITQADFTLFADTPWMAFVTGGLACVINDRVLHEAYRQECIIEAQKQAIETEHARAEKLLLNVLPAPIAERLKDTHEVIADRFDQVTVLFADVVGFTPLAARVTPEQLVAILNDIFQRFDALAAHHEVEKIKTIGDAYMAVAGVPEPRPDHAFAAADLALEMRAALAEYGEKNQHGIQVRIGLCTGPVVAGVIGASKFTYDLWGDTVNTAARMESHGVPGKIQVAESTYELLRDRYELEERGETDVKGKGLMRTWFLNGARR